MATDAQKQIRDNTLELQGFLKELKDWQHSIKQKDNSVKSQASRDTNVAPVRGRVANEPVQSRKAGSKASPVDGSSSKQKQSPGDTAAKHTYDHFRDKWDKFDVDAALKEVDEEPTKNVTFRPKIQSSERADTVPSSRASDAQPQGSLNQPGFERGLGGGGLSDVMGLRGSMSSGAMADAILEKDAGNEFFKEKKYVKAIESYSRSIGLQPTAAAYANRAMAYLKIRRFDEAITDCNEAIAMDDRYTKAYARRGTAQLELKRYLEAVEDFEFALRLEPENKQLQNNYKEAKRLYEKANGIKPSEEKVKIPLVKAGNHETPLVSDDTTEDEKLVMRPVKTSRVSEGSVKQAGTSTAAIGSPVKTPLTSEGAAASEEEVQASVRKVQGIDAVTQAAAVRAAASAMAGVARSLVAPKTSYEFETLWKGFYGDRASQARLLKLMDPASLPSVFKDALSAPLMMEIIHTLEAFFPHDADFGVDMLDHLTRVGRFSMSIMFLTRQQKSELWQLWCRVFKSQAVPEPSRKRVDQLQVAYRLP